MDDSGSRVVLNSTSSGKAQGTVRPFKRNSDSSDTSISNSGLSQHVTYLGSDDKFILKSILDFRLNLWIATFTVSLKFVLVFSYSREIWTERRDKISQFFLYLG